MWSGGIDSTYVIAKQLLETENNIFAHHISLVNCERRARAEEVAINKLCQKLSKIRDFKLTRNLIDDSKMPTIVYDMARVCFEVGAVSKAFCHHTIPIYLDKWTIGTNKEEGHWQERWDIIEPAVRAAEWSPGRDRFIKFELQDLVTKREEMDYLAKHDLLEDCWYCRTPVKIISDSVYTPCGKCKTCEEVNKAKEEMI